METIDRAFYLRRIAAAEAHRKRVVADTEAYRLVHGEGDQLPGLVIDRYGDYFTLQTLDQGMDRAKAEIVSCLEELFAPKGIAERNDVGGSETGSAAACSRVWWLARFLRHGCGAG